MAVLDGHFDLLLESHRVLKVVHIAGLVAAGLALMNRAAVAQVGVGLHAPGLIEVVLAAGAMQVRRPLVAIHPDHVVAFAPPGALDVRDREIAAQVMAAALGLQNHVVVGPCIALEVFL
jgi:hypothetical protein